MDDKAIEARTDYFQRKIIPPLIINEEIEFLRCIY